MKRLRDLTGENQLSLDATLGLKVSMEQFGGIEIEEWPARIAETAFFLVDHQCNLELAKEFGQAPDRLPIETKAHFFNKNALQLDWDEVFPAGDSVLILSNPPFLGSNTTSSEQKIDQRTLWAGAKGSGALDYVANWYRKAAEYLGDTRAKAAFVSTNSITQGEQPAIMWGEDGLARFGTKIIFAHRTFAWSSEAPGEAAVHCVIIGISNCEAGEHLPLWSYSDIHGEGTESLEKSINPYLLATPWVVVQTRSSPLVRHTPPLRFGSMPNDGGYLSDLSDETADLIRTTDPLAAKYLRRLVGSRELIQGQVRWCLWLDGADPSDLLKSPFLKDRIQATFEKRTASKRESTRKLASSPSLFGEIRQPRSEYIAVPGVSSERRNYVPMAFMDSKFIVNNALLTVETSDRFHFGILTSSVFNCWLAAVSGRLKSDIRISAEITYNNFPWPEIDDRTREKISSAAQNVLDERLKFPDATLAVLYSPISMPLGLLEAHRYLDRLVLRAYGLPPDASEKRVLGELFERYADLSLGSSEKLL
jgi:hypothetical protein